MSRVIRGAHSAAAFAVVIVLGISTVSFAQRSNPSDAVWANEAIEEPDFSGNENDRDDGAPDALETQQIEEESVFAEEPAFAEETWETSESDELTRPRGWVLSTRLGFGLGFRLGAKDEFQQSALAPAYVHGAAGVVFPSGMHELRLGVAANLNRDGTYPSGVLPFHQWTITPSYVLRIPITREFTYGLDAARNVEVTRAVVGGRLGVPIVLGTGSTFGLEVAVFGQYNVLSGLGVYAEFGFDFFVGAGTRDEAISTHMLLFLELGVSLDWEISR